MLGSFDERLRTPQVSRGQNRPAYLAKEALATTGAHGSVRVACPSRGVTWNTVWILLVLAIIGEIVEFVAGAAGAAKRGASRRSIWLSLIGASVETLLRRRLV